MHDATHYPWLGDAPDATTVPALRNRDGDLALWRAEVPLEEALAARVGSALTAIEVYANHGRWIVECPDCCDAQLAVRDDPRFMCVGCANASIGGVWRPVIWPKDAATIESLLDSRPNHLNRNWSPGEKVSALKAENKKHGVI